MSTTIWLAAAALTLVLLIAALIMLRRSWGSFPDRAGSLPPDGESALGLSRSAGVAAPSAALPPSEPASGLVPISHQLVRRSAEQALAQGGPATRYIVRQGDQIYFDFSRIEDPAQRQEAYELMRRFNAGERVDVAALMRLVNQLFK